MAPWTLQQVAEHNSRSSCWVVIKNEVYDVTEFLAEHPGGAAVILKYAGKDATAAYEPIHPPDALSQLPASKHLGPVSTEAASTLEAQQKERAQQKTKDELRIEAAQRSKPPLSRILSLRQMEDVARSVLSYKAYAYYSSAADDEISHANNLSAFSRFFFQPRVMRRLAHIDPSTTLLGTRSTLPVFVSGAALAKLGHPAGEANITRGCGYTGLIQMVSSNASLSPAQIAEARKDDSQVLWFQLYKHRDHAKALERIRNVERLGYKAIFLTVDAICAGNRERDIAAPFVLEDQEREAASSDQAETKTAGEMPRAPEDSDVLEEVQVGNIAGTAGMLIANDDMDMTWEETIPWLRSVTKLPIVIKGIQCVADAVLAAEAGCDGILISNHGGRQLEYALPSIEVLYQLRQQRPDVFDKLEVYLDGGVRRGTDVLKALCLGAKAVGLGRPFLYAQSAYGAPGVIKIIRILEREIVTGMRLIGARNVSELVPEMVERVTWEPTLAKL
ncbi:cytochrome b2 [Punctularia strigosozonata HHB-11173 SS5]|uniref:cytochrome b2 n=1 Tax=Punctularia strigosozonata (strain HHB-11173) TaxID=741275 RepID=UPI00044162AA|nr:cytochrome b2 [Punctularia strigosozonata HHB-11173 SS5]EIN13480.1 cytochrome b2 [Punctularia strigosozonata HHB-11173 SS5]